MGPGVPSDLVVCGASSQAVRSPTATATDSTLRLCALAIFPPPLVSASISPRHRRSRRGPNRQGGECFSRQSPSLAPCPARRGRAWVLPPSHSSPADPVLPAARLPAHPIPPGGADRRPP